MVNEKQTDATFSIMSGLSLLKLLFVPIHGSFPVLAMLQQPRGDGSFDELVWGSMK